MLNCGFDYCTRIPIKDGLAKFDSIYLGTYIELMHFIICWLSQSIIGQICLTY